MLNKKIIDEFEKLVTNIKFEINNSTDNIEKKKHEFRLKNVKLALSILKKYPLVIESGTDLAEIKGIGKGTIKRIDEIIENGFLSELNNNQCLNSLEELESVIGIGNVKATELYKEDNIKSVKELKEAVVLNKVYVNDIVKLGLKYYDILQKEIPYKTMETIDKFIHKHINKINKDLIVTICGSYRRKKPYSHDIDVLVVHKNIVTQKQFADGPKYLVKIINYFKKINFLIDDLTDRNIESKYMGFCRYPLSDDKIAQRIDIRYMPYESYYVALLYFTGSGVFNERMRHNAKQLGYKLNEYGLYKITKNNKYKMIKINSEMDIFETLNMIYLEPINRIN